MLTKRQVPCCNPGALMCGSLCVQLGLTEQSHSSGWLGPSGNDVPIADHGSASCLVHLTKISVCAACGSFQEVKRRGNADHAPLSNQRWQVQRVSENVGSQPDNE